MTRNINDNKTYGGKGEARKKLKDAEEMFAYVLVALIAWGIGIIIKEMVK